MSAPSCDHIDKFLAALFLDAAQNQIWKTVYRTQIIFWLIGLWNEQHFGLLKLFQPGSRMKTSKTDDKTRSSIFIL